MIFVSQLAQNGVHCNANLDMIVNDGDCREKHSDRRFQCTARVSNRAVPTRHRPVLEKVDVVNNIDSMNMTGLLALDVIVPAGKGCPKLRERFDMLTPQ